MFVCLDSEHVTLYLNGLFLCQTSTLLLLLAAVIAAVVAVVDAVVAAAACCYPLAHK